MIDMRCYQMVTAFLLIILPITLFVLAIFLLSPIKFAQITMFSAYLFLQVESDHE